MIDPVEVFEQLRSALEQVGIRYAVGGSWASTAFGEPRFTSAVDILVELTQQKLERLPRLLPRAFYVDGDEASSALRDGRPFNIIHVVTILKFGLFPAHAFPLGADELDRAIVLETRVYPFVRHPL